MGWEPRWRLLHLPDLDLDLAKVGGGAAPASQPVNIQQLLLHSGWLAPSPTPLPLHGPHTQVLAGPRYQLAAEFALHLVQSCMVVEPVVGAADLAHTLDVLSKLATRVSGGNAVLQLVEEARRVSA